MTDGERLAPGDASDSGAAARALQSASREVEAMRRGDVDPEVDPRRPILRVANAVDRSLRRILRDDDSADLSIRLKALAPDEIRIDTVLGELRRHERLPMELAAGVHDLFETRRRLEAGSIPTDADRTRAVRVSDMLADQIRKLEAGAVTDQTIEAAPMAAPRAGSDEGVGKAPPARRRRPRKRTPAGRIALAVIVLFALVFVGVRFMGDRGPSEMDQGLELFSSGDYARAAESFGRYARSNPDDPTPHLYLARIYRRMEQPELAAEAIRAAEAIAPDDAAVHRELGFLLLDAAQASVAVDRFRTAIELEPESTEGWVGLVRALRESGQGGQVAAAIAEAPPEVRALLTPADSL